LATNVLITAERMVWAIVIKFTDHCFMEWQKYAGPPN